MDKSKLLYETYWANRHSKTKYNANNQNSLGAQNEIRESVSTILRKAENMLDVGCGDGYLFRAIKAKSKNVYGCDISEVALQEAKKRGMETICADLNAAFLPYRENSFDCITCLEVLEHLIDPLNLLKNLKRILRPEGQLVLTTPNFRYFRNVAKLIFKGKFPHTTGDDFVWGGGHLHYFTRKDLGGLLAEAGFERIEFYMNQEQFERSWKRRLVLRLSGKSMFREWFCGGIVAEAFKG